MWLDSLNRLGAGSFVKSPINGGKFFHQKMPKFKLTNNE